MATETPTTKKHWTVTEVADELGVTTGRIRQILNDPEYTASGPLATKIGHYWVFTTAQFRRFRALHQEISGKSEK